MPMTIGKEVGWPAGSWTGSLNTRRLAFNADGLSSNDNTAQYPSNCKEVRVQGKNKHSSAKDDWCRYMHGPFQNVAKGQVTLTLNNLDNEHEYISLFARVYAAGEWRGGTIRLTIDDKPVWAGSRDELLCRLPGKRS